MMLLLQTIIVIFAIVVAAEFLWRTKVFGTEKTRKFVHILVGTFASSWAFYLADYQIVMLAIAMFAVVFVSRFFGLLASIHAVTRKTMGELFFPLGIAVCALLTTSPWIFMAAILHVSIADGLAALVGAKYNKEHGFKIFGHQKTVVGSLTFLSASIGINTAIVIFVPSMIISFISILIVSISATLIEIYGVYGTDDLLVPILVVGLLLALS